MQDWQHYFKGKKVTVMGLGLLGRGIGDIIFLAEEGAEILVTDLKSAAELASSIEVLKKYPSITFILGEHRLQDFQNRDFILKAASVPLDSPYIAEARKNNIPIEMSTALFAAFTPATVVGITGTRGKSTVTHLLYEILCQAYKGTEIQVFLGGNIKGVSTLPYLRTAKAGDIAVLELDSWQLQGFGERKISPHISIFTTFLPDHLNYYHNDLTAYFADKAAIFKYQKVDDILVVSEQVAATAQFIACKENIVSQLIMVDAADTKSLVVSIPGEHNLLNAALAKSAALAMGIDEPSITATLKEFKGVSGRLEKIKEQNSIIFYNDTTATTPDATMAALRALGTAKNIILIMGGADKTLPMSDLIKLLPHMVKHLVLLPGTGTDKIIQDLMALAIPYTEVKSMKEAVDRSVMNAEAGDIVLLSPAFASFGLFKNEFDRGDQFTHIVNTL